MVPNDELRRKAAAIYQRHKEAIDLIIRHKDAYVEDIRTLCKDAIGRKDGWELEHDRENLVGFAPAGWKQYPAFHCGIGWLPQTDAVLLFHFDLRDCQTVNLILTISKGDHGDVVRRRLFNMAQQNGGRFNARGHPLGGNIPTILFASTSLSRSSRERISSTGTMHRPGTEPTNGWPTFPTTSSPP